MPLVNGATSSVLTACDENACATSCFFLLLVVALGQLLPSRKIGARVSRPAARAATMAAEYPFTMSPDDWKAKLSPVEANCLRNAGTERFGAGKYNNVFPDSGYFACKGCGAHLPCT